MPETPTPSTQLVPVQYERNAWNILHGTQLEEHNDDLAPEQAHRINDNYDIVLHGGGHGNYIETAEGTRSDAHETEYDAVASMVESMQPGDALFIEHRGFTKAEAAEPVLQEFSKLSAAEKGALRDALPPGTDVEEYVREYRQRVADWLHAKRESREVGPWLYASELAALKGIPVVNADLDAVQSEKADALGFLDPEKNSEVGVDENGQSLDERIDAWRERTARNTVKDWALVHLPPVGSQPERKRGLHVLWGFKHLKPLQETFEEKGLHATTDKLEVSEERQLQLLLESMQAISALGTVMARSMAGQALPEHESGDDQTGVNGASKVA